MKDEVFPQVTRHRLEALAGSRAVPERVREQAARLMDRLQSAVRVVLLGPAGAGKTQLLSALLGQPVVDAGGLPLVLSHEAAPRRAPQAQSRVRHASFAAPALHGLQFVDVPVPSQPDRQAAAVRWALARADIVIWCTGDFDASEASYWTGVPDHLKDHSFLVLTRAQSLIQSGEMDARLQALQEIARSEFHSLYPVETGEVAQMLAAGQPVTAEADAQSGVAGLRRALIGLAETGRHAWEDAALLLLDRFGAAEATAPACPAPAPEDPPAAPAAPPARGDDALAETLRYIDTRAAEMTPGEGDADAARLILDHCLETCETVASQLADAPPAGQDFPKFQDDIAGAADKMLLIAMEDGPGPAADAVTILLQIRRELEIRLAA